MSQTRVVGLVFALLLFDFIDRQLLVSMFPYLKAEWTLSDTQLGALATVVSLAIGAGAIPVSLALARWPRTRALGFLSACWSVATALGAVTTGYWQLVATRFAVGLAQAGYVPIASTLLSHSVAPEHRSTTLGALLATAIFGSVLGIWLGGVLAAQYGWRAGLLVVGAVSLLLSFLLFSTRERTPAATSTQAATDEGTARVSLGSPTMILIYLGFTVMSLIAGTIVAWLPSHFERSIELAVDRAALLAAFVIISSGFGCLVMAWISDRLAGTQNMLRLALSSSTSLLTAALLASAFSLDAGRLQYFMLLAGAFVMLGHLGPILAAVTSLSAASQRTTAFAILVTAQNMVGLATGPLLAGWLSDRIGLADAMQLICATGVAAAIAFGSAGALQRDSIRRRPLAA
jgi:predicted MFS family arabinose efflux permease